MEAKAIAKEKLKKMIDQKDNFVLVDVLEREKYAEGHILGALNIPFNGKFESRFKKMIPDKNEFVVICGLNEHDRHSNAVKKAINMGYKNIFYYKGSLKEWIKFGGNMHTHVLG